MMIGTEMSLFGAAGGRRYWNGVTLLAHQHARSQTILCQESQQSGDSWRFRMV